jgi:hypothetical protein
MFFVTVCSSFISPRRLGQQHKTNYLCSWQVHEVSNDEYGKCTSFVIDM